MGGLTAWSRYRPSQPVEISIPSDEEGLQGNIYIGGAVVNPGLYPLAATDTIEALLQAAGGTTDNADLTRLDLHIPDTAAEQGSQKININRADVTSTVLKVAHHGSKTSTSPEFLAVVNPQIAVISVGERNLFGHPTLEVMTRLAEQLGSANAYRTDQHGTIEFITDGERLWVKVDTFNSTAIDKPPVEE